MRGAQVLSSFRERIGLALSGGDVEVARSPAAWCARCATIPRAPSPTRADDSQRESAGTAPRDGDGRRAAPRGAGGRGERALSRRPRGRRSVRSARPSQRALRRSDRLASRPASGIRAPMRPLEPDPVSRSGRRRRLQGGVGGQPPSALRHPRPGVRILARRAVRGRVRRRSSRAGSRANPPRLGINWASSLEVSYRAISWLWALQLFADAPRSTDALFAHALSSRCGGMGAHRAVPLDLLQPEHAPHRRGARPAVPRHRAPDLRGRGAVARSSGGSILAISCSVRCVRTAATSSRRCYYHRYTADIYHHALLLADANGWAQDAALRERVERLDDSSCTPSHPDGTVPLVGDDDGGRLMRLDGLPTRDARPTLATGAALFERSDMRRARRRGRRGVPLAARRRRSARRWRRSLRVAERGIARLSGRRVLRHARRLEPERDAGRSSTAAHTARSTAATRTPMRWRSRSRRTGGRC